MTDYNCGGTATSAVSGLASVSNEPSYKDRMKAEYHQLKERYTKLHKILIKLDAGTLNFPLTCPADLLREQKRYMGEYLRVLEIRAEIEGVVLE